MAGVGTALYFNPDRDLKERWKQEYIQQLDRIPVHFALLDSAKSFSFSMADIEKIVHDKRLSLADYMPMLQTVAQSLSAQKETITNVTIGLNFTDSTCTNHADYRVTIKRPDGTIDQSTSQSSCNVIVPLAYNRALDFAQSAQDAFDKRQSDSTALPQETLKEKVSGRLYGFLKREL